MIRTRYCIAISVMVASLGIVWGSSVSITAHQDEALWTKRLWNKFKLEFPYSFFAGDDPEHAETGHLLVGKEHSLAGPWSSDTLNRLEQDDDAKRNVPQVSHYSIATMDDATSVPFAVHVSKCLSCRSLANIMWPIVVNWTNDAVRTNFLPSKLSKTHHHDDPHLPASLLQPQILLKPSDIRHLARNLCETEVPVDVLKDWIILEATVQHMSQQRRNAGNTASEDQEKVFWDGGLGLNLEEILNSMERKRERRLISLEKFYVVTKRHQQHATEHERKAITEACKSLVFEAGYDEYDDSTVDDYDNIVDDDDGSSSQSVDVESFRSDEAEGNRRGHEVVVEEEEENHAGYEQREETDFVKAMLEAQEEYLRYISSNLGGQTADAEEGMAVGLKSVSGNVGPMDELDERYPPMAPRSCYDKHPQCEYWAKRGECNANPNYMVGTPQSGFCRRACGVCSPPARVPLLDGLINATDAEREIERLMTKIKSTSCDTDECCLRYDASAPGSDRERLESMIRFDPGSSAVLEHATFISSTVQELIAIEEFKPKKASETLSAMQSLNERLLSRSKVLLSKAYDEAVVSPGDFGKPRYLQHRAPDAKSSIVEKRIWEVLNGRCLYVHIGYWSYELCYQTSLLQYRFKDNDYSSPWVISLGSYSEGIYDLSTSDKTKLWPIGAKVTYVKHIFDHGNECELTMEHNPTGDDRDATSTSGPSGSESSSKKSSNGKAAGSSDVRKRHRIGDIIERQTEVMFMCSPDSEYHMTVEEPSQCTYVVEVYLPELCKIDELRATIDGHRGSGHEDTKNTRTARSDSTKTSDEEHGEAAIFEIHEHRVRGETMADGERKVSEEDPYAGYDSLDGDGDDDKEEDVASYEEDTSGEKVVEVEEDEEKEYVVVLHLDHGNEL